MHRFRSAVRRPVKRQGAEQYLLIMLLSFAASVTLTRLFLELTGYPQLGGGELHIAHVLWGGLLLYVASLLPLLVANRWVYTLCALLGGVGVGLFIDEVGKFITQTNDYFFPLAAPIIYAFFLLSVMLYLRVRRPPTRGPRAELYRAFDAMEEVLEHDLDPEERNELEERLRYISQHSSHPDLARLAEAILDFLAHESLAMAQERVSLWGMLLERWRQFEAHWVNRSRVKAGLIGGLLALGLVALANMAQALPIGPHPTSLERVLTRLIEQGQLRSLRGLNWFMARLVLETAVGTLLLTAAGLLLAGKDRLAAGLGYLSLLLSLTSVNLLIFYFDQFSAILTATIQLGILIVIAYYRQRFLADHQTPPAPPTQLETVEAAEGLPASSEQEPESR